MTVKVSSVDERAAACLRASGWLTLCMLIGSLRGASAAELDVPMDRELVTVLIRFGLSDSERGTWTGTYRLDRGRIIATDGWRFTADDYATPDAFQCDVRCFYPRFWKRLAAIPAACRWNRTACS